MIKINFNHLSATRRRAQNPHAQLHLCFFLVFQMFSTAVVPMPTISDKPLIVMCGSAVIASRITV